MSEVEVSKRYGSRKVIGGKDGWLFLANDSNDVLGQHSGTLLFPESHFERWQELLERRTEWLGERNIPYLFLIAPDNHALYPEKLPDGVRSNPDRPVLRLIRRLGNTGSPARVIYPLEEMVAAKEERPVSSPKDSHWTEFGAFVAYRSLVEKVEEARVPVRAVSEQDLTFTEVTVPGDLGQELGVEIAGSQLYADFPRNARLLHDNAVDNQGALLEFECESAPATSCLLLGDSYSWRLARYLADSFGRFVFAHTPILDRELVERERPDVVISLLVERFLRLVPDDVHGATIVEAARDKEARGRLRLSAPGGGRRERLSVEAVERVRAQLLADGGLGDAALVSVLAYSGLDRGEVLRLRWEDVGSAQLFAFVERDLEEWRIASGKPESGFVFQEAHEDFKAWRNESFRKACDAAGFSELFPSEMRQAHWNLRLRSGAAPTEVAIDAALRLQNPLLASQLRLTAELQDEIVPVEEQIRLAREKALSRA